MLENEFNVTLKLQSEIFQYEIPYYLVLDIKQKYGSIKLPLQEIVKIKTFGEIKEIESLCWFSG